MQQFPEKQALWAPLLLQELYVSASWGWEASGKRGARATEFLCKSMVSNVHFPRPPHGVTHR